MNEVSKYYSVLVQDIHSMQDSSEEGASQEQLFTQMALDMLSEAGETENAYVAYDEKALGTKKQHKINAYAISDNYETVDLFITVFKGEDSIQLISKDIIEQATKRISNFFRKAIYDEYVNEVEESSPIFEFAHTLAHYAELKENLVRVNATIITNGEYKNDFPPPQTINGYKVFYRVLDINYLFGISENSRIPIEIDFQTDNIQVPCLMSQIDNSDYQAYIAILPGQGLANLYERFGARLLEQNVRSFLQFNGKINKGIRETIKERPHMFLAYNNGIAATADHIELDESNRYITKIRNLQIVNGGQTTASIYHTWKKDKADISNIFVQVKLSVIKKEEEYSLIVSRISQYANTQNKVNDADFSANNPFLIEFEKLSRYILTPITEQSNLQTNWFFERARGQYKNIRLKDGFTKARMNQFDLKHPKKQMFTKVELAKYVNSYKEVFDGRKLLIGPHIVVRGNEKNYAQFIDNNLQVNINNVYFEDTVAKIILFKTAEKIYGVKPNNIGEMRNAVVPYVIALLGYLTKYELDLYKIWKNQRLSDSLQSVLYELMKQINKFILENSPSSHYIEWAKKEDCWNTIKYKTWSVNLTEIESDLIDRSQPSKRYIIAETDKDSAQREYELDLLNSIPFKMWKEIELWGKESGFLSILQQSTTFDISFKIKNKKPIVDSERAKAMTIFDIVCNHNIELLDKVEELAHESETSNPKPTIIPEGETISMDLVVKMVEWDKRRKNLKDWQWNTMKAITEGKYPLEGKYIYACLMNLKLLRSVGFLEE
ncbi:AIPR family protein [uncultured Bacteroides sp.]|uniref:AIPR family protein n=1 Tax=uncultured Bacteroides sp. TaxID=162156 RepID=UPI002AAB8335|nr:AIPR family protein [uncultured Bacteroides sp.]